MQRWLKGIAWMIGGVLGLGVLAVGAAYAASEVRFRKSYAVPSEPALSIAADSATLVRGQHLATAITKCVDCHGDQLDGKPFIDDPVLGRVVALNLTRGKGGLGDSLTDADLERAIRHGVARDGRSLRTMPSQEYQYLSDADLAAIVAYIRSRPAVDHELPPTKLKLLPRVLLVTGQLPFLSAEEVAAHPGAPMSVAPAPTLAYGRYLARVGGCTGCHGPTLSGGKIATGDPKWPPAANLTPAGNLGRWSEAEFVQTLRSGKRPDGSAVNPAMPWKLAGVMTDDEMHALWLYLKSVPSKEFGGH